MYVEGLSVCGEQYSDSDDELRFMGLAQQLLRQYASLLIYNIIHASVIQLSDKVLTGVSEFLANLVSVLKEVTTDNSHVNSHFFSAIHCICRLYHSLYTFLEQMTLRNALIKVPGEMMTSSFS